MSNKQSGIPPWVIRLVIIVVVLVWAANFVAQLVLGDRYDAPAGIDAIMLAIIGVIAGAASQLGRREKDEDE